ncbi:MAG: hypothetical protein HYV32_02715 [Candidatus Kerfeldbacteria bacterium]|nr:hypothetical protein [Candidatus Kerfeldbacteria bacterium]
MKKLLSKIFSQKETKTDPFSDFFRNTDSRHKTKVLKKVARKANEDQRKLIEKNHRLSGDSAI